MRRLFCILVLVLLLYIPACAEELPGAKADLSALEDFAGEYADGLDVRGMMEAAVAGKADFDAVLEWVKARVKEPAAAVFRDAGGMLAPVLLLALLGCMGCGGARFAVRLSLLCAMLRSAAAALHTAQACLEMTARFADAAAPAMSTLMAASGMASSAALLSPASAMVGNLAQDVFLRWGLPLCRLALCLAAAGGLSDAFDLSRAAKLLRRTVGWGTGLCFTLFTALIAIQGNMAASLDGVALRTAKFAVDSAAPVMGSGVSDVWDSYVSGMAVTVSAIGFSGTALLLAAGFRPLVQLGSSMLLMHVAAALLEVFGERIAARAAEQMGGVSRMALELCSGALALAAILLGAGMTAWRSVLG